MEGSRESDQQLIKRVKQGDTNAFDLLVIKYQHRVLGVIGTYISDFHEVQDIAQETFVKAFKAFGKFREESSFYTWLYRIAINTAKNHLASKGRRLPESDIDVYEVDAVDMSASLRDIESPERVIYRNEIEQVIHGVIEMLPDELRTAVILREFDGLSYDEIAEIMECPVGTVRSRIFRAREAIDKELKPLICSGQ
ncbi:ECF RNA polymerase sigma-E factor [invertebrate metagenome]|uniref:ECF RNA polymerase sigma-E factor n=1 Tax=invertebrate metagenome TaxID=1711999 RepID=A0A2H9T826_9ZZZZ